MNVTRLTYGQMILSVEFVSPSDAAAFLRLNKSNRRLRKERVHQYARDMAAGEWYEKPVAVCLSEQNELLNGQHTMEAIVTSGCGQRLLISRNTPSRTITAMDVGLVRSMGDLAKFYGGDITGVKAVTAKILTWGPSNHVTRSFHEVLQAYLSHQEVVDLVTERVGSKRVAGLNGTVLAVAARAAYSRDRGRILRFLEVLESGTADGPSDSAAIKLRDAIRSRNNGIRSAHSQVRIDLYRRAVAALDHFLNRTPITKLYGTDADLFPLPQ